MRIFYVHWNAAEAEIAVAPLRASGQEVEIESEDGQRAWKRIRDDRPDVLVVSLAHKPSHGFQTVEAVRSRKDLRDLPLVFVDGAEDVMERARGRFPDARFVTVDELPTALESIRP